MNRVFGFTLGVLSLVLFSGATVGQAPANNLVGNWTLVSIQDDGKTLPTPKDSKIIITKDEIKMSIGGGYKYKLDATKSPKAIDLMIGDHKILAIYELKDDSLKICLGNVNGLRATRFESKAKTENDQLLIFRRAR